MKRLLKEWRDYRFYYYVNFGWVTPRQDPMHILTFFHYLDIKFAIYGPGKTKIPGLVCGLTFMGYGFVFCTTGRR